MATPAQAPYDPAYWRPTPPPQVFGFEERLTQKMNRSGNRVLRGGSPQRGAQYQQGPYKGKTTGRAIEDEKRIYAVLGEDEKNHYTEWAKGTPIRSQAEQAEAAARARGDWMPAIRTGGVSQNTESAFDAMIARKGGMNKGVSGEGIPIDTKASASPSAVIMGGRTTPERPSIPGLPVDMRGPTPAISSGTRARGMGQIGEASNTPGAARAWQSAREVDAAPGKPSTRSIASDISGNPAQADYWKPRGSAPSVSGSMDAGANSADQSSTGAVFDYFNAKREERYAKAAANAWSDLGTATQAQRDGAGNMGAAGLDDNARVVAARRQARTGDTNGLASREQRASDALQAQNPKLDTAANRNLVRGGWSR